MICMWLRFAPMYEYSHVNHLLFHLKHIHIYCSLQCKLNVFNVYVVISNHLIYENQCVNSSKNQTRLQMKLNENNSHIFHSFQKQ